VAARRRSHILNSALYTMLIGIILGLVGWINQAYLLEQWRWYTTVRPFLSAKIWPYVLTAAGEGELKPRNSFRECTSDAANDYCPEMVVVPAGSFLMGTASSSTQQHERSEEPQHAVTIGSLFAVSKYEVTFDEWDVCAAYGDCRAGVSDFGWGRGRQPVIDVSWEDAKRYAAWLSKITGKSYRLLTEAEYEYAARAGTTTVYPWGDDVGENNANCNGCGTQWDNRQPAPVGSFSPNEFGLYDMVGNVYEWVADCYHADYTDAPTDGSNWTAGCPGVDRHMVRAGSWGAYPGNLRSATRKVLSADVPNRFLGFRIARTLRP